MLRQPTGKGKVCRHGVMRTDLSQWKYITRLFKASIHFDERFPSLHLLVRYFETCCDLLSSGMRCDQTSEKRLQKSDSTQYIIFYNIETTVRCLSMMISQTKNSCRFRVSASISLVLQQSCIVGAPDIEKHSTVMWIVLTNRTATFK